MNRQEHLLTRLSEELAETQQAISKALCYGLTNGHPGTDRLTNAEDIALEFAHAVAIMEMLEESGIVPRDKRWLMRAIEAKKAKVREMMDYARAVGTLHRELKR